MAQRQRRYVDWPVGQFKCAEAKLKSTRLDNPTRWLNMRSQWIALLVVAVIVEAFVIGYLADTNNNLVGELNKLQGEYRELLSKYQELQSKYQGLSSKYELATTVQYPLKLVDDANRVVVVESEPRRIVSMAPSATEILFALGLGDRVVGVTRYCNYPPVVNEMKKNGSLTVIGGYWDPDVERIVALKPALVVGYASVPSHVDVAKRLESMNVTVLLLFPRYLNDVFNNIVLVGKACGKFKEAQELVDQLRARVESVTKKVQGLPKVKVYYELWFNPLMSVGPGTFIDELIGLAGGENVFHDAKSPWPTVDSEEVISRNPDVIILPKTYMTDYNVSIEQVKSRPGWQVINAVRNNKVYFIEEDMVVREGPRLVDALEALARYIHPEAFSA
jgi:iron complex transport system substrate-binding protein